MHIAILQIYCGASGQFGSYNCQEVGLAKAFAALGHRCTVVYPEPGAAGPRSLPLADYTVLICEFANWADTAPLPCFVIKREK